MTGGTEARMASKSSVGRYIGQEPTGAWAVRYRREPGAMWRTESEHRTKREAADAMRRSNTDDPIEPKP